MVMEVFSLPAQAMTTAELITENAATAKLMPPSSTVSKMHSAVPGQERSS